MTTITNNDWKHVTTSANGLRAVVWYLRRPDGLSETLS